MILVTRLIKSKRCSTETFTYLLQDASPLLHMFPIVALSLTIGDKNNIKWNTGLGVFTVDVSIMDKLEHIANSWRTTTKQSSFLGEEAVIDF